MEHRFSTAPGDIRHSQCYARIRKVGTWKIRTSCARCKLRGPSWRRVFCGV